MEVTPIPVEVTPIPAAVASTRADDGNTTDNAHQPANQDLSPGAGKGVAGDDAAENAGSAGDAEAARAQEEAQDEAQAVAQNPQRTGADTSTVALTIVDATTP